MKRFALTILFISAISIPTQAKYSGGSGEPNDPYQIANVADLLTLSADTNDYNKCFVMTADIDLDPNLPGGQVFTTAVIARDTYRGDRYFGGVIFSGIFDGAGHKITNMTINTNSWGSEYLGLFGYVFGEIKNLRLENILIVGGDDASFIGGIMGRNGRGSISNCCSTGIIIVGRWPIFIGGLVGENNKNVSNCHSSVNITGGYKALRLGGLVGINTTGGNISNCYSSGTVAGENYSVILGGLVGYNYDGGSISNCYSTGAVTGGSGSYYLGGLVGYNFTSSIGSCYFLDTSGPDNGYGEPLTDEQMKQQASFVGWDFITPVWTINEGVDYPHLWWENTAPVADASPDQTVYAWIDGIAEVNLDGSGSYDDDNQPLTYLWTWTIDGNDYEANGVQPTVELPVGQYVISLIVNDGIVDSEPNEANITVIGPIEANLCVMPKVLNCKSFMPRIMVMLRLPKGITKDQIDSNESILLYPGQIEADKVWISRDFDYKCRAWSTTIFASFDKDELINAIDDNGLVELAVVGQLKTGQYFYGTDDIRVICPGNWPRHRPWCDHRWDRRCRGLCNFRR